MQTPLQTEQSLFMAAVHHDMKVLKLTTGLEYKLWTLLRAVSEGKRWVSVMQKDLARMCGASGNAVSSGVRSLIAKGLVERRKSKNKIYEFRTRADHGQAFARDAVEERLINMARHPVRRRTRQK